MLCSVSTFGLVLLFLIIGAFFALTALSIGKFFRPDNPTKEKLSTYECGEETVIGSWGKFNIQFYLIALVFVLFEVEIIFLFPWSKILTDSKLQALESSWKIYAFTEGIAFILILVLGLAYLWKNNLLDWKFDFLERETENKTENETENKTENKTESLASIQQRTNEEANKVIVPTSFYQKINTRYTK
jgi:NADH-quinone oxidoreductase subunit A